MFFDLPSSVYFPLYLHLIVLFSIYEASRPRADVLGSGQYVQPSDRYVWFFLVLWAVSLTLWLGLRPPGKHFGDMGTYIKAFERINPLYPMELASDPLFDYLMNIFARAGMEVKWFFLTVEAVYIGGTTFAVYRFFRHDSMPALAFVLGAFSFLSYVVNGIRHGMACSEFFLGFAFLRDRLYPLAVVLCIASYYIHASLALPVAALLTAFCYRNTKTYMALWVTCILGSLVAADYFQTFFEHLGLLDTGRREGDLTNEGVDMEGFSRQGCRGDFLLYSCVPILVGFYYVAREKFNDNWYKLMLNTYILCNSFWALVNSSWLSNRIAFLSWFMYGFVVMYPLLLKEVVPNRQQKVAIAIICNVAFTYLLWLLGRI